MKRSLAPGGYLILFEPVLSKKDFVEERRHHWKEQGMMIRQQHVYTRELGSQGFSIINERLWAKKGMLDNDIAVFVARHK